MQDTTYSDFKIITPASSLPVTVAEARRQLRNEGSSYDDAHIEALIGAATAHLERVYSLAFGSTVIEQYHSAFPERGGMLMLRIAPLINVSSVKYIDTNGIEQTWPDTEYNVSGWAASPIITPKVGKQWPTGVGDSPAAVTVRYTAGFTTAPKEIKMAILLMVGDLYTNREDRPDNMPRASQALMQPYYKFSN